MPKIRFDAICLLAICKELQDLVGARAQKWWAISEHSVCVHLFKGGNFYLIISIFAERGLIYFQTDRPPVFGELNPFVATLRKRLTNSRLVSVRQRGLDRIVDLVFSTPEGDFTLVVELMGKHSNLILHDSDRKIETAAKFLGAKKSARVILPNQKYENPPLEKRPSFLKAKDGDDLRDFEGVSPFLKQIIGVVGLEEVQRRVRDQEFKPWFAPGSGAYPLALSEAELVELGITPGAQVPDLHSTGLPEAGPGQPSGTDAPPPHPSSLRSQTLSPGGEGKTSSFNQILAFAEQNQGATEEVQIAQRSLLTQLTRVELARDVALTELRQAADTAKRAGDLQLRGELILAYAYQITPAQKTLETTDYEGNPLTITLNPDLSPQENSQTYFKKARRAKNGNENVLEQIKRVESDLITVRSLITLTEHATTLGELEKVKEEARLRRYLFTQIPVERAKEDRPFEGHAVRELLAPGGYQVFYGDNATANDYLTVKFGKPNDWWLHVRGAPSAHVLIRTNNQPDKVQKPTLEWAARIAAKHSTSKHSQYVSVDYTLKKYVRRAKGAAPGMVTYTHEKTLHVNPSE